MQQINLARLILIGLYNYTGQKMREHTALRPSSKFPAIGKRILTWHARLNGTASTATTITTTTATIWFRYTNALRGMSSVWVTDSCNSCRANPSTYGVSLFSLWRRKVTLFGRKIAGNRAVVVNPQNRYRIFKMWGPNPNHRLVSFTSAVEKTIQKFACYKLQNTASV